jgi:hypothetical protein
MILFYSIFCNHCKMLLEHIKRYDKEKTIKLVSIDDLRNKNMNIESKIHSVPAFMILPSKELLFGKAVFDYLLLPGRGILCSTQSTRIDRTNSENTGGDSGGVNSDNIIPNADVNAINGEPLAFTLNSSSFSDNFSIIEDESKELNDKNYKWDFITNDSNISDGIPINSNKDETSMKSDKNMQSIEELQKIRDAQKF